MEENLLINTKGTGQRDYIKETKQMINKSIQTDKHDKRDIYVQAREKCTVTTQAQLEETTPSMQHGGEIQMTSKVATRDVMHGMPRDAEVTLPVGATHSDSHTLTQHDVLSIIEELELQEVETTRKTIILSDEKTPRKQKRLQQQDLYDLIFNNKQVDYKKTPVLNIAVTFKNKTDNKIKCILDEF